MTGAPESQMQAVPIDDILARPRVPVDIYVNIGQDKFLVVAKAGASSINLFKYKERQLNSFYVKRDDFLKLVQLAIIEVGEVMGSDATHVQKLASLKGAMYAVHHEVSELGFDEVVFNHARIVNGATLTLLSQSPKITELLIALDQISADGIKHSMTVSMIAAMLGVAHGWTKPGTIEKLSMGGFLHDIGKTRLPLEIAQKRRDELGVVDRTIYDSHPEVGAQILLQSKSISEDVILIVEQHHELADGTGLPRGVRDLVMSPLARVVSLANEFVDELEAMPDAMTAAKARRIAEQFEIQRRHHFNRDALKALQRLFPGAKGRVAG